MKKIKYFPNCENLYLQELGLLTKDNKYTSEYERLNTKWNTFRLKNSGLSFLPKNIRFILTAPYNKLVQYYLIFDNYINNKFALKNCSNKKNKDDFLNSLLRIFNYDIKVTKKDIANGEIPSYVDSISSFLKKHAGENEFNIFSCYYCESAFIGEYNDKKDRTFDIDHFFPKKQYPIFALSLYNFVPSCQVCNSRVKGNSIFNNFYKIQNNDLFMKSISPTSEKYDFNNNVKIRIEPTIPENSKQQISFGENFSEHLEFYNISFDGTEDYKKIINAFTLEKRYNMTFIKLQALYLQDLKLKYPLEKILEIANILNNNGLNVSLEEIKNFIFHENEKFALLEKMKHDILC